MASSGSLEGSLQRWAHPRVLVLASAEVERMLAKNHLTFADLLKPLGASLENMPAIYFRSATKNYPLKNFGVKFVAPVEMEAAAIITGGTDAAASTTGAALSSSSVPGVSSPPGATDAYLDSVLRAHEPTRDRYTDGIQDAHDVASFLRTTPDPTPWFTRYRSEFHEVLRYHESELLDQPLALLVAVATTDPNPLNLIESLRSMRNLPGVFQKGIYDSPANMLRSVVVLHDKHTEAVDPEARERGANTFRLIKKQFGAEVLRLLELNSLPMGQPNLKQKDLWKADTVRTRWQAARVRPGDGATATPANSAPGPIVPPSLTVATPPAPVSSQPTLPMQPATTSPQGSRPPSINTAPYSDPSSGDQPMTPHSQSMASVSAASSAVTTNALAEMGREDVATVEQEQAELKARQAVEAQVAQQQAMAASAAASPAAALSGSSPMGASSPSSSLVDSSPLPSYEVRGQYLSPADLVQTSAFIGDFLLKSFLPHLERRVGSLGEKVAAVRKGFKNAMKSFFGTSDKTKKPSYNPRLGAYDWNSIESQARQLADVAFIVQDYELAAGSYRLCSSDAKKDKLPRQYASSQEMLGVCMALGDTSGIINQNTLRELTATFESAISSYLSIGDVRRATRASWFASDCLRWLGGVGKVNECSAILLKASEKEASIRAALSMEQAAYLFLYHLPTPLIRKYCFHLVMAGHLYHKWQQKIFGVRAYNAATILYENRAWFSVNDHLNYYLAKEYFHLGKYEESVRHFIKLIGETQSVAGVRPKQTEEKQQVFLKEFVFVVRKWQEMEAAAASAGVVVAPSGKPLKSGQVPGLKLPTVIDETIVVRTNDLATVPSAYASQAWNLALRVNPLMTLEKEVCNKPLVTLGWNSYRESERGAIVAEKIHVTFAISNPLLIELQCANVRLKCKWKSLPPAGGDGGGDEVESREGVSEGQAITPGVVFTYSTVSVTLAPLQTTSLSLTVTPLHQGTLYIEGMVWDVMDVLKGFHPFALPMRQVTFPVVGGRRRKPELQPDPSLIIPILPPAPLLDASILADGASGEGGFPQVLAHGEVVRTTLKLANRGAVALGKMCLRLSHPGLMVVAPPQQRGQAPSSEGGKCYEHIWNEGYIQLPLQLAPGEEVDLPLYVRGTLEGQHQIGLLLKYEPANSSAPISTGTTPAAAAVVGPKHRLAYLTFPLLVTPLFGLKVFTRPSFQQLADSLLGIELIDRQQTIPGLTGTLEYAGLARGALEVKKVDVQCSQVSVLSKMWTIAPLQDGGGAAGEAQPEEPQHHAGLNAPRKLHSSVSSPTVSSLAVLSTASPSHSLLASPHRSPSSSSLLPPSAILRPYESMVQFFRVTNLPGSFGNHMTQQQHQLQEKGATANGSQQKQQVHQSASANNLAKDLKDGAGAKRSVHVSSVPLSAPLGSALLIDPSHPAVAHLLHMEKALLIEEEKQTLIVNPAAVLADVGAPNRMDLVCAWRDAQGERSGFFHAPGLACMKSAPSACSLKVLLTFPRHVAHDFRPAAGGGVKGFPSGGHGLDVPVGVSIRNTLEDACVSFGFETLPPEEEFDPLKRSFRIQSSPSLKGRYTWSGSTRCRVADLPAGEKVSITLFASFPAPGVYNLNRFRFTVEQPGKKPRVFFFPLQHLIHVTQAQASRDGSQADRGDLAVGLVPFDPSLGVAASSPISEEATETSLSLDDLPSAAAAAMAAHQPQQQLESVEEVDVGVDGPPVAMADEEDAQPASTAAAGADGEADDEIAEAAAQQEAQDDDIDALASTDAVRT